MLHFQNSFEDRTTEFFRRLDKCIKHSDTVKATLLKAYGLAEEKAKTKLPKAYI